MELEKVQKQGGDKKASRALPQYGMMPSPSLASNAMHLHPYFTLLLSYTTKQTRDASALRWRPEKGTALFRSGVGFLRLSHPYFVSALFSAPSLLEMKFFRNFSP